MTVILQFNTETISTILDQITGYKTEVLRDEVVVAGRGRLHGLRRSTSVSIPTSGSTSKSNSSYVN